MTEWPGPIFAITLFARDLESAKVFYERVFAATCVWQDSNSAVFKFGELMVNLLDARESHDLVHPAAASTDVGQHHSVITLRVDDVDAEATRLNELGVALVTDPVDRPWGIRTLNFADPTGQLWELSADL
jgi:predicted enzyme related to lactoylglutathione lyase